MILNSESIVDEIYIDFKTLHYKIFKPFINELINFSGKKFLEEE